MNDSTSKADDDSKIVTILSDVVFRFTKAKLVHIELVKENAGEVLDDINAEPFPKVPLSKIPRNSRLKLNVTILEPQAQRQICGIASTSVQNGTLRQAKNVEVCESGTLPGEADRHKRVKPSTVDKIFKHIYRVVQLVMSLINALISAGVIKVEH